MSDAASNAPVTFRPIRGEKDAVILEAVHQRCKGADRVDPLSSAESLPSRDVLRSSIARAFALGEQGRWTVAEVGEDVAGYSRIACWPERDGTSVYLTLGWVVPEWRGRGIATAMLRRAEDHIRKLAAAEHPGEKAEFAANASSTEKKATELLLHEGYRAAYAVLEMRLDFSTLAGAPAPTLPLGVRLRPVSPEHIMPIARCVGDAYRGEYEAGRYDSSSTPEEFSAELREPKHDPTLWKVAWEGDHVVGQVLSVVERGRAEVFEVSVRPGWRRRGLGRALLALALQEIRARGLAEIRLHTRDDFPTRAKDLYADVGFQVLKEFPRYRKPLQGGSRRTR